MIKQITSVKNPLIKEIITLSQKSRARRETRRFVLEGLREVSRAFQAGWVLETLLYRPELIDSIELNSTLEGYEEHLERRGRLASVTHVHCSPLPFSKVAYRDQVPNVVAIARQRDHTLDLLPAPRLDSAEATPIYLVIEGIEKPGNLGAMLRTADGMGVRAVLLCDTPIDHYHPNVLRNSLGGAFSLPIARSTSAEAIDWLHTHKILLATTSLEGASPPYSVDLRPPIAIVMGAEDRGVSEAWINVSDHTLLIPMNGAVDSLNVSAATAMMLYEAARQRRSLQM